MHSVKAMRLFSFGHLLIVGSGLISAAYFFNFTAEDAYITYRYAENLVNSGSLVYNPGEPINAMTSPLHALLSAALFYVTGQTVVSYKLVALALWLVAALLVWRRFRKYPHWQLLALSLVLLPPAILLWTVGGLETPVLLFLVTWAVYLADGPPPFSLGRVGAILGLAGAAFLTRYDSSLFFLPVVLYVATKARSVRHVVAAGMGAASLPLAWFGVSVLYYGDLLPTSYYVKTPSGNFGGLLYNSQYILAYLLLVGLLPTAVLGLALLRPKRQALRLLHDHFKSMWWLYLGLGLELVYGLTMATHHMMFSFRFFVPYLPAAAILAVDFARRAADTRAKALASPSTGALLAGFVLGLALFQLYQVGYTYQHSVNGLSRFGEYRSLGVRDYERFMQILQQEAFDIEAHWALQAAHPERRPRVITYAAGILPYTFRDAYIYEKLVSYRHCQQRRDQARHADYIHILVPRLGALEQQLPKPEASYELVSAYDMFFDGSQQRFLVYYDPSPDAHNLSTQISAPCQPVASSSP